MANEFQTIKASQLAELTEVTDSNYVIVTDGDTSKKVKATNLKGDLSNINSYIIFTCRKCYFTPSIISYVIKYFLYF